MHQPSTIPRPQLERRLDGALDRRLTCVVAGAGFGKTSLLTAWAATTTSVWRSLSAPDRTLAVLVRSVTDALRTRVPVLPADLVAATTWPQGPEAGTDELGRAQAYAGRICEALATRQRRDLVLVLDDAEVLDGTTEAAAFVGALCRQAPDQLHVVLSSRSDPPFPVARLRGQGQVLDLSAGDLAFTPAETAELLGPSRGGDAAAGGDADLAALAAQLHEVTGGWPAAVRLAGEALVRGPAHERRSTLARLRQPGGLLYDYLAEEVIGTEPAEVRDLLRRLAVLDRFTPELAEALGGAGAAARLAVLVRRGLVVAAPGEGHSWLSLNGLIRNVAGATTQDDPSQARDTLTAAAAWFDGNGLPADALRCALAAGADDDIRRLVVQRGHVLLRGGDPSPVVTAVDRLPMRERTSEIHRLGGEARQLLGDWDGALSCFDAAAAAETAAGGERLSPGLAWRTGLIHHLRGDLEAALAAYARGDLDSGPAGDVGDAETGENLVDQALLVAWTATAHWLQGDGDRCRALADDAMARARRSGDDRALAAAHTAKALVAALDGDRLANDTHYVRALDHAERAGDLLQIIRVRLNRGSRSNEEGFYDEAIAELDLAISLADLGGYATFKAIALGNRGEARWRLGQLELALDDLEAAKAIFQRLDSTMVCYALGQSGDVHAARGQLALARAAYSEAADLARRSGDLQGLVPALAGLARLLAHDDPSTARRLADEAAACGPVLGHVDALLGQGWVCAAEGELEAAADLAGRAEALARSRRDRAGLAEAFELHAAAAHPGDAGHLAEARRRLNDALVLWQELRSPLGEGRALLALARLPGPDSAAVARRAERVLRPLGARRLAADAARLGASRRPPVPLAVQCLGGFALRRDGVAVPTAEWRSRKARDLVKILVAKHGRPVHRSVLVELLWPGEPAQRTSSRLSVTLSTARAVADPARAHPAGWLLVADADTIGLDLDHVEVDVLQFLDLAGRALADRKDGPSTPARAALTDAEAAYMGDAFPEDLYDDWAVPLRERARAAYIAVARTLADDAAAAADRTTAVRCYLRVLEHDAFDEHAHLGLIAAQLAAGQRGEARRAYRTYCSRMDELGVEAAPFPSSG